MARQLSKAEQDYITKNHGNMTPEQLCADMPGIGVATVNKFLSSSVMPAEEPNETPQERHEKIHKQGLKAGKLMGRDPERGIAVMTKGASEVADARRSENVPSADESARQRKDRVHVMNPQKRVR